MWFMIQCNMNSRCTHSTWVTFDVLSPRKEIHHNTQCQCSVSNSAYLVLNCYLIIFPDSKVHGANMRPTWVLSAPDGPHVGPMNLAIRVIWFCFSFTMTIIAPAHFNIHTFGAWLLTATALPQSHRDALLRVIYRLRHLVTLGETGWHREAMRPIGRGEPNGVNKQRHTEDGERHRAHCRHMAVTTHSWLKERNVSWWWPAS